MASKGSTWPTKKYPWHSDLVKVSPLVIMPKGTYRHRDTEPPTFYFKVAGDAEGEYGIKPDGQGDRLNAYFHALDEAWKAYDGKWCTLVASGRMKGEGGEVLNEVEIAFQPASEGMQAEPEPVPAPEASAPDPSQDVPPWERGQPAPDEVRGAQRADAPAAQEPAVAPWDVAEGFPYPSLEAAYTDALRAAMRIMNRAGLPATDSETARAIAATLMIAMKDWHRETRGYIPILTQGGG